MIADELELKKKIKKIRNNEAIYLNIDNKDN